MSIEKISITVEATVNALVENVWKLWTSPEHIIKWNQASNDWHTTKAENDLKHGGSFMNRMEATDGSFGFDFKGTYDTVKPNEQLSYVLEDGRKVKVIFEAFGSITKITEIFEAENENSTDMQKNGWQAILESFKKYAETIYLIR